MSNSTARRLREVANDEAALDAVILAVQKNDGQGLPSASVRHKSVAIRNNLLKDADERTEAHLSSTPKSADLFKKAANDTDFIAAVRDAFKALVLADDVSFESSGFRAAVVQILREMVDHHHLTTAGSGSEFLRIRDTGKDGSVLCVDGLVTGTGRVR